MKRLNKITQTSAMAIDVMAKSLSGKVYNLAAGDPNLPICGALKAAYAGTELIATHNYGSSQGDERLRRLLWENADEVIIANGAKQLMYMALRAVTQPGDHVILIGPCWTSYMKICEILGLEATLILPDNYEAHADGPQVPDLFDIDTEITEKTAAIVINNPNNPTGAVYDSSYMKKLLEIAKANDCYLISDEVYRYLIDDADFISLRGDKSVITIDGFSKAYNITGWRLGYAIAAKEVIEAMTGLQSQLSGPPSTLIQDILVRAWDGLEATGFDAYRERVDVLCEIPKFKNLRPQGGFYFYVPIDGKWEDTDACCRSLLEKYSIAVTPGDDYGIARTVRISVANTTKEELTEILPALKEI